MVDVTEVVKEKYGAAARRVTAGKGSACCGTAPSASCSTDPITSNLYSGSEVEGLPEKAVAASLGCGNPTALADLKAGDVVELGIAGLGEQRQLIRSAT